MRAGDVIEQVNGRKVAAPKEVTDAVATAGKGGRKGVALLINRRGQREFVALPIANG